MTHYSVLPFARTNFYKEDGQLIMFGEQSKNSTECSRPNLESGLIRIKIYILNVIWIGLNEERRIG
jgi:hypothetical protein